eukprot:738527_1
MADYTHYLCSFIILLLTIISMIIITICIRNLLCKTSIKIKGKKVIATVVSSEKSKEKIKKQSLTISYHPYIRYATIGSLILYVITDLCAFTNFMIYIILDKPAFGKNVISSVIACTWLGARILMHSVFVARLKYSFTDTIWMYHPCVFTTLYILLGIITVLALGVIVMSIVTWFGYLDTTLPMVAMPFGAFLVIFNAILLILLMYLYQHRLFQLIRSYCESVHTFKTNRQTSRQTPKLDLELVTLSDGAGARTHSTVSLSQQTLSPTEQESSVCGQDVSFAWMESVHSHSHNPERDERMNLKKDRYRKVFEYTKLELINTITQYTILLSVSVIALFILFVLKWFVVKTGYWAVSLLVVDCFIDTCCLYAHFSFGIDSYRCCCVRRFCLHNLCVSCFAKCINQSISIK